jgi:RNA polymerase primary sigma factor
MSKFEASKLVSQYFREFQKAAQLTQAEEKDLAVRIQSGDQSALAIMIKHNLKLVVKIANRHIGQGVPIDDLIQEGNLGLIDAASRYLPDTQARFASYASLWIRKRVNEAVAQTGRIVRLPHNQEIELFHAKKEKLTEDTLQAETPSQVSFDQQVGDQEGTSLGDLLFWTQSATNLAHEKEAISHKVERLLGSLKPRDKEILLDYFGIGREYEVPADMIAEKFGMTNVRVCQIVKSSLETLRQQG